MNASAFEDNMKQLHYMDIDEDRNLDYNRNILQRLIDEVFDSGSGGFSINKETMQQSHILVAATGGVLVSLNLGLYLYSIYSLKQGNRSKLTYTLHTRLTIANMVVLLALLFGQLYSPGLILSSILASVYSVGITSVVHYLSRLHSLNYQGLECPVGIQVTIISGSMIGAIFARGLNYISKLILLVITLSTASLIIIIPFACFPFLIYFLIEEGVCTDTNKIDEECSAESNNIWAFKKIWNYKVVYAILTTAGSFVCSWMPYFVAIVLLVDCNERKNGFCQNIGVYGIDIMSMLTIATNLVYPVLFIRWHKNNVWF